MQIRIGHLEQLFDDGQKKYKNMNLRKLAVSYYDIFFHRVLQLELKGCESILDVGCGSNSPLRSVRKKFYSEGYDIHKPSVAESEKKKIHDKYKIGRIEEIEKYYKDKSFDAVIAIDVIEHLYKKDGLELLKKMEKIAKKKIIIMTPNGFVYQDYGGENSFQQHKSGWAKGDFEKRGHSVYGLRSFKFVRGEHASIKLKPWLVWGFITFITEPMLYFFPDFSFHLFAVKSLKNEKVR